MLEKVSQSLKYDSNIFFVHKHIYNSASEAKLTNKREKFKIKFKTRNVLLSAQMGERASVVLICIITSRYNEVK